MILARIPLTMKKSRLSIGCQTVLREMDIQTQPCYMDGCLGTDTYLMTHAFSFPNGKVGLNDMISAAYLQRDDADLDDSSLSKMKNPGESPDFIDLVGHISHVACQEARGDAMKVLDKAHMDSMHRMDEKLHLLRLRWSSQDNRQSKSATKTHERSCREYADERDFYSDLIQNLGKPISFSFRGNGCSDTWRQVSTDKTKLRPLEIKDLHKKLALLNTHVQLNTPTDA